MAKLKGRKIGGAHVDIGGRITPLKRALSKAKVLFKKGMATLTRWAKRGAIAIGVGLAAGLAFATKAAAKQEQAEIDLAAALRQTGDATESTIKRFHKFASAIQKVTIYGDEEVLSLMAMMKNLGVNTDELENATKQAIGMAAATDRDVKSMAMYIALAKQGETTMLRRYIPALRSASNATEELAIITDFTAKGFRIAQLQAKSTSGQLKQMWNVIGDVAEKIGGALLPYIMKLAVSLKDWATKNQEIIGQKFGVYLEKIISFWREHNAGLKKVIGITGKVLVTIIKLVAEFPKLTIAIISTTIAFKTLSAAALVAWASVHPLAAALIAVGAAGTYATLKTKKAFSELLKAKKDLAKWDDPTYVAKQKQKIRASVKLYKEEQHAAEANAREKQKLQDEINKTLTSEKKEVPTEEEDAKKRLDEIKQRLRYEMDMYQKMKGFDKQYHETRLRLLRIEAMEFAKHLKGKMSVLKVFEAISVEESKEQTKQTTKERLEQLLNMYASMKGYQKQYNIVQQALWKLQAKEYAKTGLIAKEAAYAGLKAKEAVTETPTETAVKSVQNKFVGLADMWKALSTTASPAEKRMEILAQSQLAETKETNVILHQSISLQKIRKGIIVQ